VLEVVNTAATVATLVVLTAAAIAAPVQLSHMRASNQLQAFIDIYNRAQSPQMLQLFDAVAKLPENIERDPEYLNKVASGEQPMHDTLLVLAFWFDEVGIALRQRLISPEIIFQVGASAQTTVRSWQTMLPLIDAIRTRAPSAFLHFEYVAVRAQQWIQAHPQGDYPSDTPRWSQLSNNISG
jgi:hypothetical protein